MERHQKTLLSDEFGMGFAGLVAEQLLGTEDFVDVEFATSDPARYFSATGDQTTRRRPDFLMWGPNTPVFVIECKGSQTSESAVINQLRRGLEQVPTIQIPNRPTVALVIAAHLRRSDSTVLVLDPPSGSGGGEKQPPKRRKRIDGTISQTGAREFIVSEPAEFEEKIRGGADVLRLRWVGQHTAAAQLEKRLGRSARQDELPNAPLERLHTARGPFLGIRTPLAPELGPHGPLLFRGVTAATLERVAGQAADTADVQEIDADASREEPQVSIGPLGTCLAITDWPR